MGCIASKLENEDNVRRCKERRRLMKEAIYARHHLAAAHSDYCISLRNTGDALSTFAACEPLSVSNYTPAIHLQKHTPCLNPASAPVHTPPFGPSDDGPSVSDWINVYPPPSPRSEDSNQCKPNEATIQNEVQKYDNRDPSYSNLHNTNSYEDVRDNDDISSTHATISRFSNDVEVKRQNGRVGNPYWVKTGETEREGVQCSDWGDHDRYCSTSSTYVENHHEKVDDENHNFSSKRKGKANHVDDQGILVKHKDLGEISVAIKDYFDQAADAGEKVSEMLETRGAQLHWNFRHLKSKSLFSMNVIIEDFFHGFSQLLNVEATID